MPKCEWCLGRELYERYHDEEWGVPEYDSNRLFEKLILDGAQAGLSWWTILNKRDNYKIAFDHFDPNKIVKYDDDKIAELLNNPGIVRNRLKVNSVVTNAKAYLKLLDSGIEFKDYLWRYVDGKPIVNHFKKMTDVPANTELSDVISKQLKKDGFKFVGTTIIYAFMQATGMVNDHLTNCERHQKVQTYYN